MNIDIPETRVYNPFTAKSDRPVYIWADFSFTVVSYIINPRPRAVVTGSDLAERSKDATSGAVPFYSHKQTGQLHTTAGPLELSPLKGAMTR